MPISQLAEPNGVVWEEKKEGENYDVNSFLKYAIEESNLFYSRTQRIERPLARSKSPIP